MVKKTLAISLVFCVGYIVAIVRYMPASFVWDQIQTRVPEQNLPFTIVVKKGTLWRGAAQLEYESFNGSVSWQLKPLRILTGEKLVELEAQSTDSYLSGRGGYKDGYYQVEGQLSVELGAVNALRQQKIDVSGKLVVSDIQATLDPDTWLPVSLTAKVRWQGGPVSYPLGRKRQSAELPPLRGEIVQSGGDMVLEVMEEETQKAVMQLNLTPHGILKIQILKRLLDLAGVPWRKSISPDEVVFKVQQKLKKTDG